MNQTELSEFLAYVLTEKGLASHTLSAYERDLKQFLDFCNAKKLDPLRVDLAQLRTYLAHLRSLEMSPRTLARKCSALRQFYKFLFREKKVASDPSELLLVQVKHKRLPKHLSVKEMFHIISMAEGDSDVSLRDRALLELWYASGTRISEIAALQVSDLDFKSRTLRVLGKGNRERLIPVAEEALSWCRKYMEVRHEWVRTSNLNGFSGLFLQPNGVGLNRQSIWKLVKKYSKKAGIKRNVWPHMIRHSFATHVLRNGADLRVVQEMLGHRSIITTEVYTHLDIENLKVMQSKYHPRG